MLIHASWLCVNRRQPALELPAEPLELYARPADASKSIWSD
jgi:hypothetical protein